MLDFINAATYEDTCDFSIMPIENKIFSYDILKKDAIIFCKTDYVSHLFNELKFSSRKYVLITHHSDYPIDYFRFSQKPNCIKKWFAVNVTYEHSDLVPIPLGLKTHRGAYLEPNIKTLWLSENIDELKGNKKEDLIYCNWLDTNRERNNIIDKLKSNGLDYIQESNLSYEDYIVNMSKCKFVISPPGNGVDCHRTYESLYVGCVPIVIKNKIYDNWNELPIIQVKDYSEVNQNLLDNFTYKDHDMSKLYMTYWKDKIINIFKSL